MSSHERGGAIIPGGSRISSTAEEGHSEDVDEIRKPSVSPRKRGGIGERGNGEESRRPIRLDCGSQFIRKQYG